MSSPATVSVGRSVGLEEEERRGRRYSLRPILYAIGGFKKISK
jgi:hypothetical protein